MISLLQSHKQQNGPKIKYYLEPFCPLRKGILLLVRERVNLWNQFYPSLQIVDAKLTKLEFRYHDGKVAHPEASNEFENSG